jgi:hypothetical protein
MNWDICMYTCTLRAINANCLIKILCNKFYFSVFTTAMYVVQIFACSSCKELVSYWNSKTSVIIFLYFRFHRLLLAWCDREIHRNLFGIALKAYKSRNISRRFMRTCKHFREPILRKNYDSLVWEHCLKFADIYTKILNRGALSSTNILVNTLNNATLNGWPSTSLFIVNNFSFIFEHSTPLYYSSFTHFILAMNSARIIRNRFPQYLCKEWR